MKKVFSETTVRIAAEMVRGGVVFPESSTVSDSLSREDIKNAFRVASKNVSTVRQGGA